MGSKDQLPKTEVFEPNNTHDQFISPKDWSSSRKLYHSVMIGLIAFLTAFVSSIFVPSIPQIQKHYQVSEILSLLPFPIFVVGIATGVTLAGPLSEIIGRQPIYLCTIPTLGLFSLGAGLSQTYPTLLVCRFFAGFSGAPGLTATSASIADIYLPQDRLVPVSVLLGGILVAPPIGGLVGAFVVGETSWRWTQYISAVLAAFTFVTMLGMKETCETVLRRRLLSSSLRKLQAQEDITRRPALFGFRFRRDSVTRSTTGNQSVSKPSSSHSDLSVFSILYTAVAKPMRMMFTEPLCAFLSIYIALTFGIIYAFLPAIPYTFQQNYTFTPQQGGLAFIPLIVGYLLSIVFYICFVSYLRNNHTRSSKDSRLSQTDSGDVQQFHQPGSSTVVPCLQLGHKTIAHHNTTPFPAPSSKAELSLLPAVVVSPLVPITLFWFGWSAGRAHWIIPMLASGVYSFAVFTLFSAGNLYLINAYGAEHGASATSSVRLLSFILGIAFPLFILPMFKTLGIGWSMSVFGFVSVLLTPVTWVFYLKGDVLRRRSHYAVGG